jgi:hypothetical protein
MSEERSDRNQVFAGVDPRIPTTTAAQQLHADFGLDIPVETAPLPSLGLVYPPNSPLHGRHSLEIRPMTSREEDILTSKALMKKGTIISELIRSCLVDKSIEPAEMLIGDRTALMMSIRITGYGAQYDVEITCSECEQKFPNAFDLSALELQRLQIAPAEPHANVFEFLLPYTKKVARFRFLTGRDEQEITATAEKQKKLNISTGDQLVTTNLLHSIVSIDNVTDRAKLAAFVRAMPARDSLALRNYVRDNEPGIKMKQQVECPHCGHADEVGIPLGITFLWPGAGR